MLQSVCGRKRDIVQRRFRLGTGKNLFLEEVVSHWQWLPRELVQSSSLEMFEGGLDVALSVPSW